MLHKTVFLLAILTCLVLFNGNAHASPPSSSVDFAALQKKCSVINVHLDGSQHTTTCTKVRSTSVRPNTFQSDCSLRVLEIHNYNYTGDLCFSGNGYLGVKIYSVDEVDARLGPDWIHFYNPPANTCTIQSGSYAYFGTSSPVYLTQMNLNASSGPDCSHL